MIKKNNSHYYIMPFILSIMFFASLIVTGCQTKQENKPANQTSNETVQKKTVQQDTVQSQPKVEKPAVPDMKGTWSGLFDKRSAVLTISEQNGENFKGKIRINYRQPLKQDVSGTINEKTMDVKMKDLLHSRYQGKYDGKLSDNGTKFSGTFTMSVGGNKYKFEFNKK